MYGYTTLPLFGGRAQGLRARRCHDGGRSSTCPACRSRLMDGGCFALLSGATRALDPPLHCPQNDKSSAAAIHSRAQDDVEGAPGADAGYAARSLLPVACCLAPAA